MTISMGNAYNRCTRSPACGGPNNGVEESFGKKLDTKW